MAFLNYSPRLFFLLAGSGLVQSVESMNISQFLSDGNVSMFMVESISQVGEKCCNKFIDSAVCCALCGLGLQVCNCCMKKTCGKGFLGNPSMGDQAKTISPTMSRDEVPTSFACLAGPLPEKITELIQYIKNPAIRERYKEFKTPPSQGILLHGPPGTGKTMLARAIAHEAGIPFTSYKTADILSRWWGGTEANVELAFKKAREEAEKVPAKMAVIFFDEFDGLGAIRKKESSTESTQTIVHQLLAEMDGFEKNKGVIVIGATNFLDKVDPALIRPGRLGVQIYIDYPDAAKQRQILAISLEHTKYEHAKNQKEKDELITQVLECLKKKDIQATPALLTDLVQEASRKTAHDVTAQHVTNQMVLKVVAAYCKDIYNRDHKNDAHLSMYT